MFNLPERTIFNRVVPKNKFDKYTNSTQKKIFREDVERIRWTNKLSKDTINLDGKDLEEIQLFTVELRNSTRVSDLIKVIDKAIPYTIIFTFKYEDEVLISVSKKHLHPTNPDNAVIDWTFTSEWSEQAKFSITLDLRESLDHVLADLCKQLSGETNDVSLDELVELKSTEQDLLKRIKRLEQQIVREKQFNKRVELNRELNDLKRKLNTN